MTNDYKPRLLAWLLGLTPLVSAIVQTMGGFVREFVVNGAYALIAALVFIFIPNIKDFDQWFLEKTNSISTLVLALISILGVNKVILYPQNIILFFVPLTFAGSLYFLERHFNIKNILILLINLYLGWGNVVDISSLLFLLIITTGILIYLIRILITQTLSVQYSVLIFYLLSAVVIFFTYKLDTGFFPIIVTVGAIAPIILTVLLAFFIVRFQEKIHFNIRLAYSLFTLIMIQQAAIIVSKIQFNPMMLLLTFIYSVCLFNIFGNKELKMQDTKISVIIPTYNGAKTIIRTLQSVIMQNYSNWEVVIMDDGSTDDTQIVIQRFLDNNKLPIRYYRQQNQDQLNAIKHALPYITGQVVYILHSDDVLHSNDVFKLGISSLQNESCDGVFVDLQEIDAQNIPIKTVKTKSYYLNDATLIKAALANGRNPFVDFAFWQRNSFENYVKQNYLTDNLPAWYDAKLNSGLKMVNGNFIGLNYRIFAGNYLNSSDGSVNVLSGELRFLHHLLAHFSIPQFNLQSIWSRGMNKLHLATLCPVLYKKGRTTLNGITQKVIKLRLKDFSHPYIHAIVGFVENYDPEKTITVTIPDYLKIYQGADIRLFNRALANDQLDPFYYQFMEILSKGYGTIKVSVLEKDKLGQLLEFFTIRDYVQIKEKL